MADELYEEVMAGCYLDSRHKKFSGSDLVSSIVKEEFSKYPTHVKGSYNSSFNASKCRPGLRTAMQFSETPTFGNETEPNTLESENSSSISKFQCKNIKDYYGTGDKPIGEGMLQPPGDSNVSESIEKGRRDVEDAIERYTQARIVASFETYLQDTKPCYVEKCRFNKVASPDLASNNRDSNTIGLLGSIGDSMLALDLSDETYDKINHIPTESEKRRSSLSNESINCTRMPFMRSYNTQIGTGTNHKLSPTIEFDNDTSASYNISKSYRTTRVFDDDDFDEEEYDDDASSTSSEEEEEDYEEADGTLQC